MSGLLNEMQLNEPTIVIRPEIVRQVARFLWDLFDIYYLGFERKIEAIENIVNAYDIGTAKVQLSVKGTGEKAGVLELQLQVLNGIPYIDLERSSNIEEILETANEPEVQAHMRGGWIMVLRTILFKQPEIANSAKVIDVRSVQEVERSRLVTEIAATIQRTLIEKPEVNVVEEFDFCVPE